MTQRVICPLSEDPRSRRALPSAVDAAQILDATLVLFRAVEDPHQVERSRAELEQLACNTTTAEQETTIIVAVNPHAPQAIAAQGQNPDSLVVMATSTQPLAHHGYLGSAAEHVIRTVTGPTILIGPRNTTRLADVTRTVATCDGSALSEAVLPDALNWHAQLDIPLWIVICLGNPNPDPSTPESNYVRSLAEPLDAQWEVLHGHSPSRTIADWSSRALICATSHGRSGISRLAIGSVATGITRWATGPVLIRKPDTND